MLDRDVISALNELIETCRDGENGFAFAAKASSDPILIRMFIAAERSHRDATVELQDSVRLLGGYAGYSGSLKAAAHRGWLRLQNAVSARDNSRILEEREKAEDYTKMRYAEAMEPCRIVNSTPLQPGTGQSVCPECADLDRCGDCHSSSSSQVTVAERP